MFQFRFIDCWSLIGNIHEDKGKLLWVLLSQNRGSYPPPFLFCHISIVSLHPHHPFFIVFFTSPPHSFYCFPPPTPPHFHCFLYTSPTLIVLFSPATSTAFLLFSLDQHHIDCIVFPRHLHCIFIVFFRPAPH